MHVIKLRHRGSSASFLPGLFLFHLRKGDICFVNLWKCLDMELGTTRQAPSAEDFTALSTHQEQTPGSFFSAKPVLHLHSPGATIKVSRTDLDQQETLKTLLDHVDATQSSDASNEPIEVDSIDVWVSSKYAECPPPPPGTAGSSTELSIPRQLMLYSGSKQLGINIPYPAIVVHAQEGSAVLLGLNLSDSNTPDEDLAFIQLRIVPDAIDGQQSSETTTTQLNGYPSPAGLALFKAISDCQELNPDPPLDGDEELDETAPGASGWITSENMQDFVDENGDFRMPQGVTVVGDDGVREGGLGEGAGRARTAAEAQDDEANDETKWQRTG